VVRNRQILPGRYSSPAFLSITYLARAAHACPVNHLGTHTMVIASALSVPDSDVRCARVRGRVVAALDGDFSIARAGTEIESAMHNHKHGTRH
jgi:hypothetical protein